MNQSRATKVVLHGTWVKRGRLVSRADVNWYRRRMRNLARDRGWEFEATCPYKGQTLGELAGEFVFTVYVTTYGNGLKQAEHALHILMRDAMCVPPTIKVNLRRSTRYFVHNRINGFEVA